VTARGAIIYAAAAGSMAALAILASVSPTSDPDVYWHMHTARTALSLRSALPTDPFSYSMAGAPWHHKDWLAEGILYLGFAALGYAWFAALKAAAALATPLLLHASVARAWRAPWLLVGVAGATVNSFWFIEQPAVFSIVLFASVLALEERAWQAARGEGWIGGVLGAWVAVNVAWTWLHRFSLLGHGLLVVFAGLLVASRLSGRPAAAALLGPPAPPRAVRSACLAAVAGPLFALANPGGAHALFGGFTMALHPELRAEFWEWKGAGLVELWTAFPVAVVACGTAALWGVARVARAVLLRERASPVRAVHVLLAAGLGAMTASSVRWMPYLAMLAIALLARLVGEALDRALPARLDAIASVAAGAIAVAGFAYQRRQTPYVVGEDPVFAPRGAVAFARDHGLDGRVANGFDLGGYLLWSDPDVRVLVDGRNELVYPPALVVRCLRAEHDASTFAAMRAADGVSWAMGVNAPGRPGFGFLAADPAWAMVYWSETAAVYVRRDAHAELAPLFFRYVEPRDIAGSVLRAVRGAAADARAATAIGREVARMREASPDSGRALLAEVVYDDAIGPPRARERDDALQRLARVASGDPEVLDFVEFMRRRTPTR
jgi:hypothetical protein